MAKAALSFRFSDEFVSLLRTCSFVTEKDQRILLEEAFLEYLERRPDMQQKIHKINETLNE